MLLFIVFLLGGWVCGILSVENNVCPTYKDYYTIKNNPNCWYDLSAEFDAPSIIRLNGYPVMEYKVPVRDGFVLRMFRIPSDNVRNPNARKHPVYLQHGIIATCANFLALGKNSLAFVLADAGYDVWLGNYRANQYSEEHLNLTVYDEEYWEHSMDEIVQYDLPASFRMILLHSEPNSQIIYIGHSLGTTLALMYAAEFPEEAQSIIKMFVLMAPAYTLTNMISPYGKLAPFGTSIVAAVRKLGLTRVLSQAEPLQSVVSRLCLESPGLMQLCMKLYNLFYGLHNDVGPESVPVYFNQLPGGTALKVLNHAGDLVMGNFRKYDHGHQLNQEYYGSPTPPIYDIKNVHVPVYIIYSTQDWATTEADAINLYNSLPREARYGIKRISLPNFNHIGFTFGRRAREIVYDDLVKILDKVIEV